MTPRPKAEGEGAEVLHSYAKRVALWCSAFIAVCTVLGMINKWLIADPIGRVNGRLLEALAAERMARQEGDRQIISAIAGIRHFDLPDVVDKLGDVGDNAASKQQLRNETQRISAKLDSLLEIEGRQRSGWRWP